MEKLQQWLKEKCSEQNLSWREASMKMGRNAGFISSVMGGQVPGLESCKALAKFFRVSPVLVLQMAGHIENMPNSPMHDPQFAALAALWPDLTDDFKRIMVEFARKDKAYNLRMRQQQEHPDHSNHS